MSTRREHELQRRMEQLEIALQAAHQRLQQYETVYNMAVCFLAGDVISDPQSRPILVASSFRDKDTVFAVIPQDINLPDVEQGGKYIFAGECDGQFDTRCKTHHMILRAEHIFPAALQSIGLPPREQLGMFVITKFINMFNLGSK